jgi:low temperature requirement protein LtrA
MFDALMLVFQCMLMLLSSANPNLVYVVALLDLCFVPLRLLFNVVARHFFPDLNLFPHPLNIWKMQERHAIWVVLALGESIVQITKVFIVTASPAHGCL